MGTGDGGEKTVGGRRWGGDGGGETVARRRYGEKETVTRRRLSFRTLSCFSSFESIAAIIFVPCSHATNSMCF